MKAKAAADGKVPVSNKMFVAKDAEVFLRTYTLGKVLGEGAFGKVFKCTHKATKTVLAVKTLEKDPDYTQELKKDFANEVGVLTQLDYPNVLKIFDCFEDKKRYYIVMELLQGGELVDMLTKLTKFTEKDAATVTKTLV